MLYNLLLMFHLDIGFFVIAYCHKLWKLSHQLKERCLRGPLGGKQQPFPQVGRQTRPGRPTRSSHRKWISGEHTGNEIWIDQIYLALVNITKGGIKPPGVLYLVVVLHDRNPENDTCHSPGRTRLFNCPVSSQLKHCNFDDGIRCLDRNTER